MLFVNGGYLILNGYIFKVDLLNTGFAWLHALNPVIPWYAPYPLLPTPPNGKLGS